MVLTLAKAISAVLGTSCIIKLSFRFIADQEGDWEKGILPIYSCNSYRTGRVMLGWLAAKT